MLDLFFQGPEVVGDGGGFGNCTIGIAIADEQDIGAEVRDISERVADEDAAAEPARGVFESDRTFTGAANEACCRDAV